MRCYRENHEVICIDDSDKIMINLTRRKYKFLADDEYDKILEKLKNDKEVQVVIVEQHRYFPRIYVSIIRVSISAKRYRYFIEEYDGSSASYSYYFCIKKKQCLQILNDLAEDTIVMY